MRMVFIGPSHIDDPKVHEIFIRRAEVAKYLHMDFSALDQGRVPAAPLMHNYATMLRSMFDVEVIDEVRIVMPGIFGEQSETEALDGCWESSLTFQRDGLPALRAHIRNMIGDGDDTLVHVDLGSTMGMLYAAYFATLEEIPTAVTFHPPEPEQSFAVGGHSVYARFRPMLRRKLANEMCRRAQQVGVADPRLAEGLVALFPEHDLMIYQDPLTCDSSPSVDDILSSIAVGG